MKKLTNGGFTLIEILMVVTIMAVLGASTTPFLSRMILRNQLALTQEKLLSSISKAQSYAMAKKNNATWGTCLTGTTLRFFSGSCASPTYFEDFVIPGSISVSGLPETTFTIRGEPAEPRTIAVVASINSYSIILNSAGGMDVIK